MSGAVTEMTIRVKRWTPEELEAFRDELWKALDALEDELNAIKFLLDEALEE